VPQRLLREEEGLCKGLVGMLVGDASKVEDMARCLNLPPDLSQSLMLVAVGNYRCDLEDLATLLQGR
jgi:hypothetical protein